MPPSRPRALILGGTEEAYDLAQILAADHRLIIRTSLAGRTRSPRLPAGECRIGGFGGAEGLADYLRHEAIDLLIDATHPFAQRMNRNAEVAASSVGLPILRLLRPAWFPRPGDCWHGASDNREAAQIAQNLGQRIFLAVGRRDLEPFAALARQGKSIHLRLVDPPGADFPLPDAEILLARGPFDEAGEKALFLDKAIDLVIAKNSGGDAGYAKIAAARDLGIPIIMIARPNSHDRPKAPIAPNVEAALAWIAARLASPL